ncbi:MAG: hypothetical protein LBV23_08630 [Deltaproteobacteria bacterium]|nr:hypothetical protein [Deltaproteobacteria bacterium]
MAALNAPGRIESLRNRSSIISSHSRLNLCRFIALSPVILRSSSYRDWSRLDRGCVFGIKFIVVLV